MRLNVILLAWHRGAYYSKIEKLYHLALIHHETVLFEGTPRHTQNTIHEHHRSRCERYRKYVLRQSESALGVVGRGVFYTADLLLNRHLNTGGIQLPSAKQL